MFFLSSFFIFFFINVYLLTVKQALHTTTTTIIVVPDSKEKGLEMQTCVLEPLVWVFFIIILMFYLLKIKQAIIIFVVSNDNERVLVTRMSLQVQYFSFPIITFLYNIHLDFAYSLAPPPP